MPADEPVTSATAPFSPKSFSTSPDMDAPCGCGHRYRDHGVNNCPSVDGRIRARREQFPRSRQALEAARAALGEFEAGARGQFGHDARDPDFAGLRLRHHPRSGVDREAADVVAAQFDLAGVHAGAQRKPGRANRRTERQRATHRAARTVEGRQQPVAGAFDPMTAMFVDACKNAYAGKMTRAGTIPLPAWTAIKRPYKELMNLLLSLPVHVLICGRMGTDFAEDDAGELKNLGFKMRAEGETAYEPDVLIRLEAHKANRKDVAIPLAHVEKDRTGILAGQSIPWPTFDNIARPLLGLSGHDTGGGPVRRRGRPAGRRGTDAAGDRTGGALDSAGRPVRGPVRPGGRHRGTGANRQGIDAAGQGPIGGQGLGPRTPRLRHALGQLKAETTVQHDANGRPEGAAVVGQPPDTVRCRSTTPFAHEAAVAASGRW